MEWCSKILHRCHPVIFLLSSVRLSHCYCVHTFYFTAMDPVKQNAKHTRTHSHTCIYQKTKQLNSKSTFKQHKQVTSITVNTYLITDLLITLCMHFKAAHYSLSAEYLLNHLGLQTVLLSILSYIPKRKKKRKQQKLRVEW